MDATPCMIDAKGGTSPKRTGSVLRTLATPSWANRYRMDPFILRHFAILLFAYGLAFFVFGLVILIQPTRESSFGIRHSLVLLGMFGVLHASQEWFDMFLSLSPDSWHPGVIQACQIIGNYAGTASFVFLLLFSLHAIAFLVPRFEWTKLASVVFFTTVLLVGTILGVKNHFSHSFLVEWQIGVRYGIGFPASLGTAFVFFRYGDLPEVRQLGSRLIIRSAKGLAFVFAIYAIVAGLVVPPGSFFPASWLNTDSFFRWSGIPIQVLRAVCAFAAALLIGGILRLFSSESRKKLQSAVESLEQFGVQLENRIEERTAELAGANRAIQMELEERRRVEGALRQSETKLKALFENANDAILILNGGKISSCNLRALSLFQRPKEDLLGAAVAAFSPLNQADGRTTEEVVQELFHSSLTGVPQFFEWRHSRPDGSTFDVEVSLSRVVTQDGEYSQAILRDITERKQSERALQEAHTRLNVALNRSERILRDAAKLTELVDILQSCQTVEEGYRVIASALPANLSQASGALCITAPSRNIVEAVVTWGAAPPIEKTFAPENCWALRRGKVHEVGDAASPLRCGHAGKSLASGFLCIPLVAHGETMGVLCLERVAPAGDAALLPEEDAMEALARQANAVGERISLALANLRLREVLRGQSIRDPLTGLFNRRFMEESLDREVQRASRNGAEVALLLVDLDHFKQFNDTFGHQAGDTLLREFGEFLRQRTRGQDVACRYGGEEFVVILTGASLDAGSKRAEYLREELKHLIVTHVGQVLGAVTASVGISAYPVHGATGEELLRAADTALYIAKSEGRDRAVTATTARSRG